MIEHFIDGRSTGIIDQDTLVNREFAQKWIQRYNAHYGTNKKVTFKKIGTTNE